MQRWAQQALLKPSDTPSNFGFGGERPTNPELLEYLANEFVKNGMSIKKLQRFIMLSATYGVLVLISIIQKKRSIATPANRVLWSLVKLLESKSG